MLETIENDNRDEINYLKDLFHQFAIQEAKLSNITQEIGNALIKSKKSNIITALKKVLNLDSHYINYFKQIVQTTNNKIPNYLLLLEHYFLNPPKNNNVNPIKRLMMAVKGFFDSGENIALYDKETRKDLHELLSMMFYISQDELDLSYLDPLRHTYCVVCTCHSTEKGLNIAYAKKLKFTNSTFRYKYMFNENNSGYYPIPLCDDCYNKIASSGHMLKNIKGVQYFYSDVKIRKFSYRYLVEVYLIALERYYELHRVLDGKAKKYYDRPDSKQTVILQITNNT